MNTPSKPFCFTGKGTGYGPWHRSEDANDIVKNEAAFGHPAGYISSDELIEAVKTALILGKPLLLTGDPGSGKSELAERIAWESQLGPVLRFEAQSLSEAKELFYHFDHVGRLAEANLVKLKGSYVDKKALTKPFISFGPLGKAILRSNPNAYSDLYCIAFPRSAVPDVGVRSVVLIDEIDKASRDFPNDLLNGIERLAFRLPEFDNIEVKAPAKTTRDAHNLNPIVIITSNAERDLPGPFLRRCAYFHIEAPGKELLRKILANRLYGLGRDDLDKLYQEMLDFYVEAVPSAEADNQYFAYKPGTSELLDWARVVHMRGANLRAGITENFPLLRATLSVLAKTKEDCIRLQRDLDKHKPPEKHG